MYDHVRAIRIPCCSQLPHTDAKLESRANNHVHVQQTQKLTKKTPIFLQRYCQEVDGQRPLADKRTPGNGRQPAVGGRWLGAGWAVPTPPAVGGLSPRLQRSVSTPNPQIRAALMHCSQLLRRLFTHKHHTAGYQKKHTHWNSKLK